MSGDVTAVIIGRAGSKGLPRKNATPLEGRPVVTHTIEDAKDAATITQIYVSTDCPEIAAAARREQVPVVDRPRDLASDTARVDDAVRHAIEVTGDVAPIVVILYANVPVRPDDLIDRAVHRLRETGADSVQSYSDVGKFHPLWMVDVDPADGRVTTSGVAVHRRQELPAKHIPDGGVIAVTRERLLAAAGDPNPHAFLGDDRRGVVNTLGEVVDIDSVFDLRLAEARLT